MRLKKGFLLHDVGTEHMAVAMGEASKEFNGIIRNNETAHFIFQLLLEDVTMDEIVGRLSQQYDAPADVIRQDAEELIAKLRKEGLLDE